MMGVFKAHLFFIISCIFWIYSQSAQAVQNSNSSFAFDSLLNMSLDELIEVEVTVATGTPKPLKLAPSVATVIQAQEIKNIGARTVNEALETVAGLHVGVSTKNSMSQIYSIRGIHTSINPQVLLLMNGIPVSMALTGTRAFFNMPVSSIERIEVIRGPGSAVYGADAFAGIINIITRDGKSIDGTKTAVRAGSFDTYDVFLQHGETYNSWDIFMNIEYQTSKGDSSRIVDSDLQTMLDKALGTNVSLTPASLETGYEILDMHFGVKKDNWTFRLWGEIQDGESKDGVTNVLSQKGDLDIDQYLADLTYNTDDLIDNLTLTSRLYLMYYQQDARVQIFPDGSVLPIGADGNIDLATPAGITYFPDGVWGQPVQKDQQAGLEFSGLYHGLEPHRIRSAIGYKYLSEEHKEYKNFGPGILNGSQTMQDGTLTDVTGTEDIYAPDKSRQLIFFSLQDEWVFYKHWELVAGVRYDYYSDFGDTINPRIALVWQSFEKLTTKILYGQAFRPPAFNELYNQNNPANIGNKDLEPEKIQTVEFVADYQPLSNLHLRLNLFSYEIEDLIELVQDSGQTTQTSQNSKNHAGHGFELEAELLVTKNLLMKGNLAYQKSEDRDSGVPVPDAPEWQAYFNMHWTFMPDWSFNGQYYWIAGRERAYGDPRENIEDYHVVNLTIRKEKIFQNLEAAVRVRNLFNEDVREPGTPVMANDYPMEERSFWAEIRFHF